MGPVRTEPPQDALVSRCPEMTKGRRSGSSSSRASVQSLYGQLDLRVTVFEVIGIPGNVGVLSESAEVPVAVAE